MATASDTKRLGEQVLAQLPAIVEVIVERVMEKVPGYSDARIPALRELNLATLQWIVQAALIEGRAPTEDDLAALREGARLRAEGGLPREAILTAMPIVHELLWAQMVRSAQGYSEGALAAGGSRLALWSTAVGAEVTAAYHQLALETARADDRRRSELLSQLFTGFVTPDLIRDAREAGLDPNDHYVAIRADALAGSAVDFERELSAAVRRVGGLVAYVDGSLAAVTHDLCEFTTDALLAVGPSASLDRMGWSWRLASLVLTSARAQHRHGIVTIAELGSTVAIDTHPDLGEYLHARYVEPVLHEGRFGESVLDTVAALIDCGSIDAAAQQLFVHPNSVRHRIRRYEALTNAHLHDTATARDVWWAITWHRHTRVGRYSLSGVRDRPDS